MSFYTCSILNNLFVVCSSTTHHIIRILSTVLQLAGIDVITTYVAVMEIWALNHHSWCFSENICPIFLGSEILFNTLILYLTICINFHVISKSNLHEFEMQNSIKNPLTANNDDDDDSSKSLIGRTSNQKSYRNITINYQNKKSSISVIFPSVLLWFICLSISIPEFSLSSAVKLKNHFTMCTVVDIYFNKLMQHLLVVFRILIPLPLLLLLMITVAAMYLRSKKVDDDTGKNILDKKTENIKSILVFSFILSAIGVISSFPRQFISVMHLMNQKFENDNIVGFKMVPLENVFTSYLIITIIGIIYYSAGTFRGILYVVMLPEMKNVLRYKITFCNNRNNNKNSI
ncbi:uncharacterized protein LOC108740003 isoform X2 [Agrilus planipennis]|uniref:Uncharacterized protein LOC108740003 isoform X2 n=1 Tax=Agrilus planipennis TaxID=224129 RepID=A0A7F5RG62_AGRPL|nr:uncharacterized protein LOC108740003 isoform X2 [Agrilus planipennis]